MKRSGRRALIWGLWGLTVVGGFQACKKKSDGSGSEPLGPATLEFLGAENTAGQEFEAGDDIELSCDGLLTVHLGPEGDSAGTIENWNLRPRNICGDIDQCGYITVEVLDEDGDPLEVFEQAVASPLLDLSGLELADIRSLRATLTWGDSGESYVDDDGLLVEALWEATITQSCDGFGGAGGESSGSGGSDTGTGGSGNGTGGDGGQGGAGGAATL